MHFLNSGTFASKTDNRFAIRLILAIALVASLLNVTTLSANSQGDSPPEEDRESRSFLFHPAETGILTVFDVEIEAGQSQALTVLVGNNGEVVQDIHVYPINVRTGTHGGMVADDYGAELNAVSNWVGFDDEVVTLDPGEGLERTFTVRVPDGTPPGEYIGAVAGAHAGDIEVEGSENFRQRLRYIAPIFITVPGEMSASFSLGPPVLTVDHDVLFIDIPVVNDGDMHVSPEGEITLRDSENQTIASIPIAMPPVFARESALLTVDIPGGLPAGEYRLEAAFSDADTGASAVIENAVVHADVAATPEPEQFRIAAAAVTAGPSEDDVQFVTVTAGIVNQGDPAVGMQLSLIAFLDGEEIERFPINQSLSLPTGETPITTRYIPSTGFTAGAWTFELLLETVEPNGTAIVVARAPIEGTIVVGD